jgi:hypothetical protein
MSRRLDATTAARCQPPRDLDACHARCVTRSSIHPREHRRTRREVPPKAAPQHDAEGCAATRRRRLRRNTTPKALRNVPPNVTIKKTNSRFGSFVLMVTQHAQRVPAFGVADVHAPIRARESFVWRE